MSESELVGCFVVSSVVNVISIAMVIWFYYKSTMNESLTELSNREYAIMNEQNKDLRRKLSVIHSILHDVKGRFPEGEPINE